MPTDLSLKEELVITDLLLRLWGLQVQELSAELENPSRPERENGAFYTFMPGGTRRLRNACFVQKNGAERRLCPDGGPVPGAHSKAMRMTCKLLPRAE